MSDEVTYDDLFGDEAINESINETVHTTTTTATTTTTPSDTNNNDGDDDNVLLDDLFGDDVDDDEVDAFPSKPIPSTTEQQQQSTSTSSTTTVGEIEPHVQAAGSVLSARPTYHPEGAPELFKIDRYKPFSFTSDGLPQPTITSPGTNIKLPSTNDALHSRLCVFDLPRQIGIAPTPYDKNTFDPVELASTFPLFTAQFTQGVENIVRWRNVYDSAGNIIKRESNARLIHWDNGDIHFQIGREYYPVHVIDLTQRQDHKTASEPLLRHLMIQTGGLYYHIGYISHMIKVSCSQQQLVKWGPRSEAAQKRLRQLEAEARIARQTQKAIIKEEDQ